MYQKSLNTQKEVQFYIFLNRMTLLKRGEKFSRNKEIWLFWKNLIL